MMRDTITIEARIDTSTNILHVFQEVDYVNNSIDTLSEILFHTWGTSYRNRDTDLGVRSREDRDVGFYFAKDEERGDLVEVDFKVDSSSLKWQYYGSKNDIAKVTLKKRLFPNEKVKISIPFKLKLPNSKFTEFGYNDNGYYLKQWYISPVVYSESRWSVMSNKNLEDIFIRPSYYDIKLDFPKGFSISSNLEYKLVGDSVVDIYGVSNKSIDISVNRKAKFKKYKVVTDSLNTIEVETDIRYPFLFSLEFPFDKLLQRQLNFLEKKLGKYKNYKLWANSEYLDRNPIYTMNTIPLVETMGPKFQKEIEVFKAMSHAYIESSLYVNKRENSWIIEGLNSYLLSVYIEEFYPEKKLFGNLSDYWISRMFDLSDLKFNDRQQILYLIMARQNLDQPIAIDYDKFANLNLLAIDQFKASMGLAYLRDYIGEDDFDESLKELFEDSHDTYIDLNVIKKVFSDNTHNKSDWFFDDYLSKRSLIDYKLKREGDTDIIITNKTDYTGPLKVFGYKNDSLVYSEWLSGFDDTVRYTPPLNLDIDRIVLNDNNSIPEYNFRDNTLKYDKKWYDVIDKPLQLKLLTDIENPHYTQVFLNPDASWNAYDGLLLGGMFHNKSLIRRPFNYSVTPYYAFNAKTVTGSAAASYTHYFRDSDLFHSMSFGMFAKYSHYDEGLSYVKYNPAVRLFFKRPDPRGVDNNYLYARYISVDKEIPYSKLPSSDLGKYEEYKVFNLRHVFEDPEVISDYRIRTDLQVGDKFGKFSTEIRYRKETDWRNRIDIRLFAGVFLYNNVGNTYYDFGINSSTDYLFDYSFLGRSESTGVLSQQIIVNDGAFKTIYNEFANNWLVSTNAHISIWKFFEVYGDVGAYANTGFETKFIWDTGVRFNFVPEILEFYFPIYSNMGNEFNVPNYEEKIRFVITADFDEIVRYFRRGLF